MQLGVDIFSGVVGVLGIIGVVIVGISYMTAGGDVAKATKAKRRIVEIVIGLALYMTAFALVRWLGMGG